LKEAIFEDSPGANEDPKGSRSPVAQTPQFLRQRSHHINRTWQRHTFNWSIYAAILAFAGPTASGALLGHAVAGVAIGAVALIAVGFLAFGLWALDNTLPF